MDCPDVCLEALWLQEWAWVLEYCHKRSCWKNSIGVSVPGPYRSDVYVCSKSCWLYLTVVYWLLECNKVPLWIEPPSTLQYDIINLTCLLKQLNEAKIISEQGKDTFLLTRTEQVRPYAEKSFLQTLSAAWSSYSIENMSAAHRVALEWVPGCAPLSPVWG
jgi:hypothetical protein